MKLIITFLILTVILSGAFLEVKQNIKALYKGVELTEAQEDYILDNQDANSEILQRVLSKDIKNLKLNYLNEKNVISFILTPSGEVKDIMFLQKSNNRKLNRLTKKVINKVPNKFIIPKEETNLRFIISYRVGHNKQNFNEMSNEESIKASPSRKTYNQNISKGTTRFEHSSKEYVRTFETSKDGFINLNVGPNLCMNKVTLLTENGKRLAIVGKYNMLINKEVAKGKYKILMQTDMVCDVHLQYP